MIRHHSRPKKTIEDYMQLPDDVRAELIEGELLMSPSPKERHQRIVLNLVRALDPVITPQHLGLLYFAPFDVHLPSGDIVQPDLFFVAECNRHIVQDWVRGVPDLVIEVVSPESPERDRFVKRDLYARNGVLEYWLVDDTSKSIEVLKLSGSTYKPLGYFEQQDRVESTVLADLDLPVGDVFASYPAQA